MYSLQTATDAAAGNPFGGIVLILLGIILFGSLVAVPFLLLSLQRTLKDIRNELRALNSRIAGQERKVLGGPENRQ